MGERPMRHWGSRDQWRLSMLKLLETEPRIGRWWFGISNWTLEELWFLWTFPDKNMKPAIPAIWRFANKSREAEVEFEEAQIVDRFLDLMVCLLLMCSASTSKPVQETLTHTEQAPQSSLKLRVSNERRGQAVRTLVAVTNNRELKAAEQHLFCLQAALKNIMCNPNENFWKHKLVQKISWHQRSTAPQQKFSDKIQTTTSCTAKLTATIRRPVVEKEKNYVQPQQEETEARTQQVTTLTTWNFWHKTHPMTSSKTPKLESVSQDENLDRESVECKAKQGVWIPCRLREPTGRAGPQFEKPGKRVARARWVVYVCVCQWLLPPFLRGLFLPSSPATPPLCIYG